MKKRILAIVLILSLVMSMMPGMAFASTTAQNYELRTLTFEDSDYKGGQNFAGGTNWTSLVDSNQYGGPLLYGSEGMGYANAEEAYYWHDKGNTELTSRLSAAYGSYCFWSGGHAISNYVSGDYATNGTYENQLTVYKEGVEGIAKAGGGYNGSDNFAIHYGYIDGSEYNMTEYLPSFSFADGTARVIDHMYVNGTAYFLNCVYNGNELTEKVKEGDYVYLEATGYNGETKTESVQLPIVDGPNRILKDWTKWDLSGLGEVTKVEFNVCGSSDNGFGFSQAAYFAYDNVAVRFPKESPVVPTDLKLDKETAELNVGDSLKLNAVVEPEDAQTDTIT
ncbi:MAG: DUF4465 domain-containing protein, partial [Firmicutes bacterium]|nr:DUF4465 domain-containing protein [Bacillota bacterium]